MELTKNVSKYSVMASHGMSECCGAVVTAIISGRHKVGTNGLNLISKLEVEERKKCDWKKIQR